MKIENIKKENRIKKRGKNKKIISFIVSFLLK